MLARSRGASRATALAFDRPGMRSATSTTLSSPPLPSAAP